MDSRIQYIDLSWDKVNYLKLQKVKEEKDEKVVVLDERLLLTPSIAIAQCYKVTATMAKITREKNFLMRTATRFHN